MTDLAPPAVRSPKRAEAWALRARAMARAAASSATGNPFWLQAAWFVDPVNGHDSAAGDAAHPVKTIMGGIVARWGTRAPVLPQTTTITVLGDETIDQEEVVLEPILVDGSNFVLLGTLSPVVTFPLGAVTPKSETSPGNDLGAAGFVDPSIRVGELVVNTTRGSSAVIDALAAGTATLTQPMTNASLTTVTALPAPAADNGWAMGDSVTVYRRSQVNLKLLAPAGGDSDVAQATPTCWVQDIQVPEVAGPGNEGFSTTPIIPVGVGLVLSRDRFDTFLQVDAGDQEVGAFSMCTWGNGGGSLNAITVAGGAYNSSTNFYTILRGVTTSDLDVIYHSSLIIRAGQAFLGAVHVTGAIDVEETSALVIKGTFGAAIVWGSATLGTTPPLAAIQNRTAGPWSACLKLGGLSLDGAATGTSYAPGAPGVWTDGVALSIANLDANGGLQNPRSGSRYAGP